MSAEPVFVFFGSAHLVVIFLIIFIPLGLGFAVRHTGSRRLDRAVAVG